MASEGDVPPRADGAEVGSRPVDPVAGKTVAEILGEIVWLMTQDPAGREMKVSDIEQLIMPAILQRRFHIKYVKVPDLRQMGATVLQPVELDIQDGSNSSVALNFKASGSFNRGRANGVNQK